jgi:putative ABC transport system ATP-binding protein
MFSPHFSPHAESLSSSALASSPAPDSARAPLLKVRHATVCVTGDDGATRTIFSDINLDLYPGQIIDITGPSGAGKSSLLTTIACLNPHGRAEMTFKGKDAHSINPHQWRAYVSYVHQKPILTGETIRDALLFPWTLSIRRKGNKPTDEQMRSALDRAGLADISISRPIADISGGQLARVSLIRTLLTHPCVLLADEIDAALDPVADQRIEAMIAEQAKAGMAVVRVRHRSLDGLETRVLRLENGVLSAEEKQAKSTAGEKRNSL